MPRTIVVGDVHGCVDELRALLREAAFAAGDRLVLVGDLVAKGPDSRAVVQLAREAGALAVLGNHDVHVLRGGGRPRAAAFGGPKPRDKARPEHRAVVDALATADWAYLEALPLWLRLGPEADGATDTVVVHAGAISGRAIEAQEAEHLLTLRSIAPGGTPSKKIEGTPWAAAWRGPERIVFGHDAVRGLQEHPLATGLDTGCVYGGRLTALVLPERRLVSVAARRAYVRG